ncbi:MAG: hypothetical protein E6G33_13830 [Actinobacteria bacterium]|nr:MAG: hypothetical protein E6G33_13830 [Actinomycetota bacterium]
MGATADVTLANEMTRAALLKAGLACGLVAVTARAEGLLQLPAWMPWTGASTHLRRSSYAAQLNTTFRIRQDGARPLALTLEKIDDLSGNGAGSDGQFALLFSGPARPAFRQDRNHVVVHPALGRFHLAVFPVGRPTSRQHYEAIVNRLDR